MQRANPSAYVVIAAVAAMCLTSSAKAQWGTLKGRVVLTGDVPDVPLLHEKGDTLVKEPICRAIDLPDDSLAVDPDSRGIANVFVFLYRAPDEIHPDFAENEPDDIVFDQKDCRFKPHAMVVRTGQTVMVKSDDPVLHNTHTRPLLNSAHNWGIPPKDREGVPISFRQREPSPVQVTCDIHPWMSAWWLVADHPYAAVTDEQGEYTIEKLPAGEHTFRVWHERAGWVDKSLSVSIADGETTMQPPIEIPAADVAGN